ncbi:Non-heme dioxygenase N-terminal domain-containing protein [Cynara cardunculus var. scolymus]|uniref:Non-heme dioxygenase N-terminal domain-containing protein n=1 Tax=Cynara cardunculus var. scolymus TaxID=59895 RepID=A0A103YBD0_CYNCS|nr:Non-heme dioxygenase N-terminal domain-containing protein [Cynara cardunculus var. scolymus]
MGSEAPFQLPTVDFSDLYKQDSDSLIWDSAKTKALQALQEYGCFEATFAQISSDLQESVFDGLEQLFNLPLETKQGNTSDRDFHGYIGQIPFMPLYESMGIDAPYIPEKVDKFTSLMKSIQTYSKKLWELDEMVKMMVFEGLDLEKYLDEHLEATNYHLKVMKYRAADPSESTMGLDSHADTSILTILHQNGIQGLEIRTKDGDWLTVNVSPNSFVTRLSVGLFSLPKIGSLVKPPKEMVDEEYPLLFKPFDYGEFMDYFCMAGVKKDTYSLKAYCGVSNS